jgi:hypothetical protein
VLRNGGYINAVDSLSVRIAAFVANLAVDVLRKIGKQKVYPFPVSGDHTYCADGIWSLE